MVAGGGGGRYGATATTTPSQWGSGSEEQEDLLGKGGERQYAGSRGVATQRTALLRDTIKLTHETQDMADELMGTMESQRQALSQGTEQVSDMRGFTHQARRLLAQMARRAACRKATLWAIIVLLCVVIGLVLYREFTNHGHLL